MLKDTLVTTLTAVGKLPDLLRSARSDSLIEYTRVTRAEPICLMDPAVVHLPYAHDIMQSLTAIFAGYYLQAVAISVNVGKIDTIKMLEKVNPSRSPAENAGMLIGEVMLAEESYKHKLPDFKALKRHVSMEAPDDRKGEHGMGLGKNTTVTAQSLANLSVGMLLEVNIESEGNKATIPVSVRLIVSAIAQDALLHILSYAEQDRSVGERYHAWRAGQLEFIRDCILCQDIIADHRKTLIKDGSGQYRAILQRRDSNRLAALLSGQPSVATASNIIVMTTATASVLEAKIGARLKDFKTRERIFDKTYMMIMVVVDPQWEQVTIYHRSLEIPTQVSIKELKTANKGSGPDVAEILKAYQLGNAPTI